MPARGRRQFLEGTLALAGLGLLSGCGIHPPKAAKAHRIGFLIGSPRSALASRTEAFEQGLRELGYTDGKDIVIEWRSWEGDLDRRRSLVAELVALRVDAIVAGGSTDALAAREATTAIPIIVIVGRAPVEGGLVASLARPGGNITGLATLNPELTGKRLEYLKAIVPGLSRVAVFASPSGTDHAGVKNIIDLAASPLVWAESARMCRRFRRRAVRPPRGFAPRHRGRCRHRGGVAALGRRAGDRAPGAPGGGCGPAPW